MASFNLKIEDSSPLISYAPDGAWTDPPSTDSPVVASYSGRSLHTTSAQGATATINFNGTGISIFGGRRSNYGTFTIAVDGQTFTRGDARNTEQEFSVNQLLGSASGLINGPHSAVLSNTGGGPIDIDWVDVTSQVGSPTSKLSVTTFDDTDASVQYSPSTSAWGINTNQAFVNNTLHFTSTPGASASLSFVGDAVAVYGTMAPDHANVQIMVDGRSRIFTGGANGFVSGLRPQVLLYYENNLVSAPHVITMTSVAQETTGAFMDIDAITVYSTNTVSDPDNPSSTSGSSGGSNSGDSTSGESKPSPAASRTSGTSKSAIIGGAVAGAVVLILLLIYVLFVFRRRRNRPRTPGIDKRDIRPQLSPKTPDLPMQGESMMEAGFSRVTPIANVSGYPSPAPPAPPAPVFRSDSIARHSIAPSYYSDPSYASDGGGQSRTSSLRSSTALVPPVPRSPASPRLASPRGSGLMMNVTRSPRRPSRRPPPLEFEQ